jgi:sulfide:quinone oxidoreductase
MAGQDTNGTAAHHDVVIIGGGSGGITVASRLLNKGVTDVAVIEPSDTHWYQPLWTLVGGGLVKSPTTRRPMSDVMPRKATWIRSAATSVEPDVNTVVLADGSRVTYDWLVVAAGIQLDWDRVPGLADTLGHNGVSSNYKVELAEETWRNIESLRSGTALFTMPAGPIKCAGAPQKIAYLACDHWRKKGVLNDIDVHLVLPTPKMFGIPEFSATLDKVAARYGITVHLASQLTAIDGPSRTATITANEGGATTTITFDMAHVVPPQSAPDWLKKSSLADPDNPGRYVKVDKHTLANPDHRNVFALGDCTTTPNSKTGAAIRKQAPVLVANLMAARRGAATTESYDGYASCPIVTSSKTCVMAEFDYDLKRTPTFPVIDMTKERRDMYVVKRWLLPIMYWKLMLRGRA